MIDWGRISAVAGRPLFGRAGGAVLGGGFEMFFTFKLKIFYFQVEKGTVYTILLILNFDC